MDEPKLLKTLAFTETIPNADWQFRLPDDPGIESCQSITNDVKPDESPHGAALKIAIPGDNSIVHAMPATKVSRIEIRIKRGWTVIYVGLAVIDIRRRTVPGAYLLIDMNSPEKRGEKPERHGTPNEWCIHPQWEFINEGQWEKITVDVPQEFANSFGLEGSTLNGVQGLVIRGDCEISTVEFFG